MKKSPGLGGHGRAVTNITTPCNIVLLGSAGSGKTAIVQQFITRTLCQDYFPTTLETFMLISTVDNEKYRLHVCDCSGSKGFKDHRAPYIAEADGLMFVYSITEMHSLLYLLESAKEAYNVRRKQSVKVSLPILFVGTNADAPPEQRVVEMPNAEGVAADCLSTLGVKLSKRESRSVKKIKADTSKGAADGISFTYPVLEIASVNHREVVQAMQIMIRLVRSFRETSRLPPVCLMYKKIERLRLNPSDLMNVAAASPNASSEASVYYMTSEFGGGNRPEFYPTCNSPTVTSDPGEGVSYSPRSACATPSVYSSIILGEEDDDRDRTSVLNEEEYLQGPTTTNSCNVVASPVWTCGLEDRSRNVVSGDEVSRPETSSSGVTPQRNETKREPKHRECPICNIM